MTFTHGDLVEINDDEGRTYEGTVIVPHVRIEGLDMIGIQSTLGLPARLVVEARLASVIASNA